MTPIRNQRRRKPSRIKDFARRVERGVAFLDALLGRENWLYSHDLSKLNLSDGDVCICGQLFDGHWDAFLKAADKLRVDEKRRHALGFSLGDDDKNNGGYDLLTRLWRDKIRALRSQ